MLRVFSLVARWYIVVDVLTNQERRSSSRRVRKQNGVGEVFFRYLARKKQNRSPKTDRSEEERKAVKKQYKQTKRKREFQTHWLKEFQWLEHTEKDGMTRKIYKVRRGHC